MTLMTLDPAACYRAFASRDRRFDGRFVTAVLTTRVYCRPGCPARLPARRNVRFFAHPAAAEAAGFRPCLRCRPETAPGSPAWNGTSAIVARALRLIEEGAMDEGSVENLAARLGVTSRWLRTLFVEQVGAAPLAVARTRRVHFARRLLDTTTLSLEELALAAGFGSARRLRAAFGRTFRRAPSAVRVASEGRTGSAPSGGTRLTLIARPPFDPAPLFAFLAARAVPGVEHAGADVYARSVRVEGEAGVIVVRPLPPHPTRVGLALHVERTGARALLPIATRVGRLFDLGCDVSAIARHLKRDPALARRIPRHGVRVPGAWDPFETAVRTILGQQISVAAARTLAARLAVRYGEPLPEPFLPEGAPGQPTPAPLTHLFPTAAALADSDLDGIGLPRARASTLRTFAAAVAEGRLELDRLGELDQAVARLTALPGIGPWTAHAIAMRALGEPDAFPASDLGILRALAEPGRSMDPRAALARAEGWRPWRAYAVLALWGALAGRSPRRGPPSKRRSHAPRTRRKP